MPINVAPALTPKKYCILPKQCIQVFCRTLTKKKIAITSLHIINIIGCVKEKECVSFVVQTYFLNSL